MSSKNWYEYRHHFDDDDCGTPQYDCRDTEGFCALCTYVVSAVRAIAREIKAIFSHLADAFPRM